MLAVAWWGNQISAGLAYAKWHYQSFLLAGRSWFYSSWPKFCFNYISGFSQQELCNGRDVKWGQMLEVEAKPSRPKSAWGKNKITCTGNGPAKCQPFLTCRANTGCPQRANMRSAYLAHMGPPYGACNGPTWREQTGPILGHFVGPTLGHHVGPERGPHYGPMWAQFALFMLALCGHPTLALQDKTGWHFVGPLCSGWLGCYHRPHGENFKDNTSRLSL